MQETNNSFFIDASDKYPINAMLYQGSGRSPHLIIISGAAGAPQLYYKTFANFVSMDFEFDAITFDYRGIGKSQGESIKSSDATMYQWGQLDLDAVINWASDKYDKIFLLGHSVAGQVFPYAENRNRISAAYFIASQSAYFGYWRGFEKIKTLLFWYLILPLATKFYGFLPGWTMGGNVSLPKGVAKEWRKWGISKSGFLKSDPKARDKFNDLHIPIHFICLADDSLFGPPEAVQALMHRYGNSKTSFQFIKPSDLKVKSIGHFGFFKSKHQEKLWSMPVMYFTQFVKNFNQG